MLQPVLYLALFGPLLAGYRRARRWRVFVPGMLMQLSLMSAGMAGFGIVFDARFGVLERLRVTPASRVCGPAPGPVLTNTVVLLSRRWCWSSSASRSGFRVPVAGLLIGLALIVPLAVGLAALSYAFALDAQTAGAVRADVQHDHRADAAAVRVELIAQRAQALVLGSIEQALPGDAGLAGDVGEPAREVGDHRRCLDRGPGQVGGDHLGQGVELGPGPLGIPHPVLVEHDAEIAGALAHLVESAAAIARQFIRATPPESNSL